jgi:hypothetical protein
MKLYRGQYGDFDTKYDHPLFGRFAFFGADRDIAESHGEDCFSIDVEDAELEIGDPQTFWFEELWESPEIDSLKEEVADLVGEDDPDVLDEYLTGREVSYDAEASWKLQGLRAEAGRVLGYDGIEETDEHGVSYMLDMRSPRVVKYLQAEGDKKIK